jgi:hypothetical protein
MSATLSPAFDPPFRMLALDIRPRFINAIVATKSRGAMKIERAVSVSTIGNANDAIGKGLIKALGAGGLHTIAALDPRHVATTHVPVEPYIQYRDYDGLANRNAAKLTRPTNKTRRVRWRSTDHDGILVSVANDEAVDALADTLRKWGCRPWIIADPSLAWLETLAPNGIVDDLDGTTLFAAPDDDGVVRNDIIPYEPDSHRFLTAAINIIQTEHVKSPIPTLAYFGPAERYRALRASLLGLNIRLDPALPPEHNQTEPWTFALALAAYGAAQ